MSLCRGPNGHYRHRGAVISDQTALEMLMRDPYAVIPDDLWRRRVLNEITDAWLLTQPPPPWRLSQ